jgi:hypothetical protein
VAASSLFAFPLPHAFYSATVLSTTYFMQIKGAAELNQAFPYEPFYAREDAIGIYLHKDL